MLSLTAMQRLRHHRKLLGTLSSVSVSTRAKLPAAPARDGGPAQQKRERPPPAGNRCSTSK